MGRLSKGSQDPCAPQPPMLPHFLLAIPGTQVLPSPWASQGTYLQPPTPTPEVRSALSKGPAARLFWRPLHTLVPKLTPLSWGRRPCVNRQSGGVKAATVAKGAAGLVLPARLVMRIPHGLCSPRQPVSLLPSHVPTARRGKKTYGAEAGFNLARALWTRSCEPGTASPGRRNRWGTGAGVNKR